MSIDINITQKMIGFAITKIGNSLPIKAPGRTFKVPDDQKYYEIFLIRNPVSGETWGDEKDFTGNLRVILHWPNNDEGDYPPLQLISTLKDQFPKGEVIFSDEINLSIHREPNISDPIEDGQERLFPLTVPYRCFHAPA